MPDVEKIEKVDIVEVLEPAPKVEKSVPTREEMREAGWSASELDAAEKRGMIQKNGTSPDKKKEDENGKKPPEAGTPTEKQPTAKADGEEKKPEPKKNAIPDFSMTPEQEKVFLQTFGEGTPQHGTYLRMKSERRARQAAEARAKELEAQIESLKKAAETPTPKKELDDEGNPIDPEDKPLTVKQLKELERQREEERRKAEDELHLRAQVVAEAQKEQEEYARALYPDFDETGKLAVEVMKNLETLIPDEAEQEEVLDLIHQLQVKAASADKYSLTSFNAARVAYKIGTFHPEYAKRKGNGQGAEPDKDGKSKDPTKANGSLTPEQMKRIEANTQRRASSASIPGGGGKRTIAVEEVGLKELNAMSFEQRQKFKEKYPEQYAKLLRG